MFPSCEYDSTLFFGGVDRKLRVVDAQAIAVCVPICEQAPSSILSGEGPIPGHEVRRIESSLLNLGEIVLGVSIQLQFANLDERVILLGPYLGQVKGIESVLGQHQQRA